ncbi:MAG: transcriptional activator domain protein, partial [Chthonomonadales bacterium]|nr:transcriptional activator domain protein [Chthonomonadales bacterium]
MTHNAAPARLEIRLLGPFDARIDAQPLMRLRTRKGRHLLALLAVHHGREIEREWLAATLWPESEMAQGFYNLRRALSDLRAALGSAAHAITAPTPHSLRLENDDLIRIDLAQFDALRRRADVSSLQAAVDLYRGAFLEGWNEEWLTGYRETYRQECLHALGGLAALSADRKDWADAARALKKSIAIDPFQEQAQRQLMEALSQAGNEAAAMLVYREFRYRLRNEINAEPTADLTALFERLRNTARLTSGPSRSKREKREPETGSRPSALPAQLNRFIGRDEERLRLQAALTQNRLLTLVGSGGCGKTRLALQVASEAEASFPEGVVWLEFAALTRSDSIWRVVANSLGLKAQAESTLSIAVCNAIGNQKRLLIFDNCEHLLADIGATVAALLRACPEVRVIATSREPLRVTGEMTWRVPSLSAPKWVRQGRLWISEQGQTVETTMRYESTRLFADRAALADPRFAVTDANAPTISEICGRLDGIPLAIELAASCVGAVTLPRIAARLDDRFRLLTVGRNDLLPRQQTLRAVIDWSYDLLTDLERVLFRRLSVFAGGWTLAAAEAIVASNEILDTAIAEPPHDSDPVSRELHSLEVFELHSRLIDKSLIVYEEGADGDARYRMLETIRQYAVERLWEAGEAPWARARHARWFTLLAEQAEQQLLGHEQASVLAQLETEHDNLRAALDVSLCSDQGLRMICSLWRFWYVRGYMREASEWFRTALEESREITKPMLRARALLRAGLFARAQNRFEEAEGYHTQSLQICRQEQHENGIASALGNLGALAQVRKDFAQAAHYYEEALAILRRLPSAPELAALLLNLGGVLHTLGDLTRAHTLHEESLRLRRERGDSIGLALTLGGLARIHLDQRNFLAAEECLREGLKIDQATGDRLGCAHLLDCAALIALAQGDPRRAVLLFGMTEKVYEDIGSQRVPGLDPDIDAAILQAKAVLGGPDFTATWEEGRT